MRGFLRRRWVARIKDVDDKNNLVHRSHHQLSLLVLLLVLRLLSVTVIATARPASEVTEIDRES